jgi:hypothetical protein
MRLLALYLKSHGLSHETISFPLIENIFLQKKALTNGLFPKYQKKTSTFQKIKYRPPKFAALAFKI